MNDVGTLKIMGGCPQPLNLSDYIRVTGVGISKAVERHPQLQNFSLEIQFINLEKSPGLIMKL